MGVVVAVVEVVLVVNLRLMEWTIGRLVRNLYLLDLLVMVIVILERNQIGGLGVLLLNQIAGPEVHLVKRSSSDRGWCWIQGKMMVL
jgi:hypothetical protein